MPQPCRYHVTLAAHTTTFEISSLSSFLPLLPVLFFTAPSERKPHIQTQRGKMTASGRVGAVAAVVNRGKGNEDSEFKGRKTKPWEDAMRRGKVCTAMSLSGFTIIDAVITFVLAVAVTDSGRLSGSDDLLAVVLSHRFLPLLRLWCWCRCCVAVVVVVRWWYLLLLFWWWWWWCMWWWR
ncbi:hypothetical protein PIB30_033418 [Stylosanthes scabra]|uniref:PGG domain-containing protein n=1 Tax=Stylosanthes scabra TaxID=79078 RepID=A0ABU6RCN0_9FABA|nr:hypothetical protein [Stylosanthes scabra]